MKHKILQVTPYYPPNFEFGGPVKLVSEIGELLKENYDISIYTYVFNEFKHYKDQRNLEVKRFKPFNKKIAKKFNCYYSSSLSTALKQDIKKFSLVHTHDFRSVHNIKLIKLCKQNNVPVIMSSYKSINPETGQSSLKKIYDVFFGNNIIKNIDHFIAVNEMEKQDIMKYKVPEKKITIIPNCIKQEDFSSAPNYFKNKYNIAKDKKVLLFFSRLHEYKRPDIVIKAFAKANKQIDNSVLVMYGPDGGQINSLKNTVKELNLINKIMFIPKAAGSEKNAVYNESDLLIQPSPYNEFPLVLIEALAHGLPIITSETSIKDIINNKCAKVIECNEDQYAKNIIDLLNNQLLLDKYKQNAKKVYLENFTIDKYIKKINTLYSKILNQDD